MKEYKPHHPDASLVSDFDFLKIFVREDSDTKMACVSLEGHGFYRQFVGWATVGQFMQNSDGVKDEIIDLLFQSSKHLAENLLECLAAYKENRACNIKYKS